MYKPANNIVAYLSSKSTDNWGYRRCLKIKRMKLLLLLIFAKKELWTKCNILAYVKEKCFTEVVAESSFIITRKSISPVSWFVLKGRGQVNLKEDSGVKSTFSQFSDVWEYLPYFQE